MFKTYVVANNLSFLQHNHPISSILSYQPHVDSLKANIRVLSRIDVAFPSEEKKRDTLSQKLLSTRQDVSRLNENAAEYAGHSTILHVYSWISCYAALLQQEASRIFEGFQQYSDSIVKALPFWEFLPYYKHYKEHGLSHPTILFILLTTHYSGQGN
jgi:hypothetical protein